MLSRVRHAPYVPPPAFGILSLSVAIWVRSGFAFLDQGVLTFFQEV